MIGEDKQLKENLAGESLNAKEAITRKRQESLAAEKSLAESVEKQEKLIKMVSGLTASLADFFKTTQMRGEDLVQEREINLKKLSDLATSLQVSCGQVEESLRRYPREVEAHLGKLEKQWTRRVKVEKWKVWFILATALLLSLGSGFLGWKMRGDEGEKKVAAIAIEAMSFSEFMIEKYPKETVRYWQNFRAWKDQQAKGQGR